MARTIFLSLLFVLINGFILNTGLKAQNPVVAIPGQLDFGPTPVFQARYLKVELSNQSDALVYFLEPALSSDAYMAYPQTYAIPAGDTIEMFVGFQPDNDTVFDATLSLNIYTAFGVDTLIIPLTGEGFILKPSNLTAILDDSLVTLNWFPPGASPEELRFGSGQPLSALGTSSGKYEFSQRFTAADLLPYSGKQVDAVEIYIFDDNADFSLKVYTDEFAGEAIIDLPVEMMTANSWNEITLPFPLVLSELDFLWIGYETDQLDVEFIAGVDGGPGVNGSGDMVKVDGSAWGTLADYGFDYNWCIRGLLSDGQGLSVWRNSGDNTGSRNLAGLMGYNVYRDGVKLNDSLLTETSFADQVETGDTYEYGVTAVYSYGEGQPALITVSFPTPLNMPEGWSFTSTSLAHNIHIPFDVLQIGATLIPGDMIGVFYEDDGLEKCAGAGLWNGTDFLLTAYGDNPSSPEKEGFSFHETLKWKLFAHQTGMTLPLMAAYDASMPHHEGTFQVMGLSMLQSLAYDGTVNVGKLNFQDESITIYPNPSQGRFYLSGLNGNDQVRIFDSRGRVVYSEVVQNSLINIDLETPGIYYVEIIGADQPHRRKIIVR